MFLVDNRRRWSQNSVVAVFRATSPEKDHMLNTIKASCKNVVRFERLSFYIVYQRQKQNKINLMISIFEISSFDK